jgi:hypothetical protein
MGYDDSMHILNRLGSISVLSFGQCFNAYDTTDDEINGRHLRFRTYPALRATVFQPALLTAAVHHPPFFPYPTPKLPQHGKMTRGTPLARTTSRTETHQSVRHKTLSSYYPNLNRLSDLIPIPLVRPDDEAEYVELVRSAIWALREQNGLSDRLVDLVNQRDVQHGYRRSHQELVDVIMEEVARRGKNVLSMTPRVRTSQWSHSPATRRHTTHPALDERSDAAGRAVTLRRVLARTATPYYASAPSCFPHITVTVRAPLRRL